MTNKEKETMFREALRQANEDVDAAKAYVRLNPVSTSNNWKGNDTYLEYIGMF